MDLGNIILNNGDIVLIRSKEDLTSVIEEKLSKDIADAMSEYFIEKGNKDDILNKVYELAESISDLSIDIQNTVYDNY